MKDHAYCMREGQTRLTLEHAVHASSKKAFSIVLLGDYRVTKPLIKSSAVTVAQPSSPGPMDIDAIDSSGDRRRATP